MMNQTNSGFLNSIPPVTKNLIIINLLFWVASLALPKVGIDLVDLLGLHFPGATDFKAYQIVSYMFMHDTHSFAHVFFNMFAVYMFGRVLENVWGPKRFLIFYFVTGIGAGLVQGILLAFAMIFPNVPLYLMFIPIPIKAKYFVIFYGLAELFMGVASFGGDTVAHFAHLGGMLFGYFLIRYWKKKDADNGRYFY